MKAVRSSDLDGERWDLISYIAIKRFVEEANTHPGYAKENIIACLLNSIDCAYAYLWGHRELDYLANGMYDLACAYQMQNCGGNYKSSVLPYHAMQALAQTCHEGAVEYGTHNWLFGFSIESLLNHAIKHIVKVINGYKDENDYGHALWGFMAAMHMEDTNPDASRYLLGPNGTITEAIRERLEEHAARRKHNS